jgi:dienelactone hydrolase
MKGLRVALLALVLGGAGRVAHAQGIAAPTTPDREGRPRFGIDSDEFRQALSDPYWEWLAAVPCRVDPWRPDLSSRASFARSADELRAALARRIGPRGEAGAGHVVHREVISEGPGYQVEYVIYSGRIAPTVLRAYLVTPTGRTDPLPAVMLIHGAGTLPRQAMGWRFAGANQIGYPTAPISDLASNLAESGYAVLVPYVREDVSTLWPFQPWISLDRAGALFREKRGGSGLGIAVAEMESAVDFLAREPGVDRTKLVAMGWEEGAEFAAITAAFDPRISALVRLMPPRDLRRWRASAAGVAANPGSMQLDCAYGDREMAAMLAPRPILYDWSPKDPTFRRSRFYVDTTVIDRARDFYAASGRGGGITLQGSEAPAGARAMRIVSWLDQRFGRPSARTIATGTPPPLPADPGRILAWNDSVVTSLGFAIGRMGTCHAPELPVPSMRNTVTFATDAARWRAAIATELRIPAPGRVAPRILVRDTIEQNPEFTLEWVVTNATVTGLPLMGLLATPTQGVEDHPALLTFDGNFFAGEPFGLPPRGTTRYLKSYARKAAQRGVVVFAPTIPAWFMEAGESILSVRDPQGPTMWGTVLGQVRAATDLLLARPDVDSSRMTLQGISGAGVVALYGAALDLRVTTLIYSNPINTGDSMFVDPVGSLLSTWYSPICGTFNLAQQYLIAPRRFIWENGIDDANGYERSPQEAARAVASVYERLGISERFTLLRHGGGHEEQPEMLWGLDPYRGSRQ